MKYTYAIAALLASANAINFGPSEQLDLQVGVDAAARSNVRQTLKNQLRAALSHDGIKFQNQKFGDDGYPGFIIPGSEPLLPIPSAPIDMNNVQINSEMGDAELTVAEARAQAAQMQAQMDASVAEGTTAAEALFGPHAGSEAQLRGLPLIKLTTPHYAQLLMLPDAKLLDPRTLL